MKTPEQQRIEELEKQCAMWKQEVEVVTVARDQLVAKKLELEKQNAVMREALSFCQLHEHDGSRDESGSHYSDSCSVCKQIEKALTGSATQDYIHKRELDVTKQLLKDIIQLYFGNGPTLKRIENELKRLEKFSTVQSTP